MGEYLRTKEAAALLNITVRTLYKRAKEGYWSTYKPGGKLLLFKKTDIENYIEKCKIQTLSEVEDQLIKNLKKQK